MEFSRLRGTAVLLETLAGVKSIDRGSGELNPFWIGRGVGDGVVSSASMGSEGSDSGADTLSESIESSRSRSRSRSGSGGSFEVVLIALFIVAVRMWQCSECGGTIDVVLWLVQLVWLRSEF